MTQHNRPPKLYVTSDFLEMARDEGVTGAAAHNSAHEVIDRGSQGRLRGLSISRLVLHTSDDIQDGKLTVHRVGPHEPTNNEFTTGDRLGVHPRAFIEQGLPEVHSLVVPVKEFDPMATAWGLHNAAARYAQDRGVSGPGEEDLRPPTEGFGAPGLDAALGAGLHLLGRIISRSMPEDRRESPEELAGQLRDGILPVVGRGVDAIRAVQNLPGGTDDTPAQAPVLPLTPAEMAGIVGQEPPTFFYPNR